MDLKFKKSACPCMERVAWDVQNQEQTQEVKLPDGMPDIGRVLSTWGQCVLRGKEWRGGGLTVSGGVMTRTLYVSAENGQPVCMEAWIPFQIKRDLPETEHDGVMRVSCLLQSADARAISDRKLMVRIDVTAVTEALMPAEKEIDTPGEETADVQLLKRTYPVRLPKEAGEKTFLLDEELTLPASCPAPEKLITYELRPELVDQKVVSGRLVFRGTAHLHGLYQTEEGDLHPCNLEIPFSQFTELDREYGDEAQAHIIPAVTSLELELEDERLHLKGGLVAQYLISDRELLELVEDAYSPQRTVRVTQQPLLLPVTLEQRRENFRGEQELSGVNGEIVDVTYFPDHPRVVRSGDMASLEVPGAFQTLYRDQEGNLQSSLTRFSCQKEFPLAENGDIYAMTMNSSQPQTAIGGSGVLAATEVSVDMLTVSDQGMDMVTGLEVGEMTEPDPNRPSLILRRVGDEPLWDLAKRCGSTVDAIRQANQLQAEPVIGQILLIPVP